MLADYARLHILVGLGLMNVGVPGITPRSIAMMTFINPELPAAGSECPVLLLIYVYKRASAGL